MPDNDPPSLEPTEVWDGVLRTVREVEVRDRTIVVTHRVTATTAGTIQFVVVDPFPGEFEVDEIGFHPDYEPSHGTLDSGQAVISGIVGESEEVVVRYGFRPRNDQTRQRIRRRQSAAEPSIELASKVSDDEAAERDLEAATMRRSAATDPSDPDDRLRRRFEAMRATTEAAGEQGDEGTEQGDEGTPEDETPTLSEVLDAGQPEDETPASEWPSGQTSVGGDPFGESAHDVSLAAALSAEAAEAAAERAGHVEVVEALLDALESDALDDEHRRRFGSQLDDLLDAAESSQSSVEVRLRHLETQLGRFAAYADALEAIIDEHGPAEQFLGDVRGDVEAVASRTDELEQAVEQAAEWRSSQLDWLDELGAQVETIDARQRRLRNQLEALEESQRQETAEIERRLDEVEPVVETVRSMRADAAALRQSVESLEDRLSAVGEVLTDEARD